MLFPLTKEHEPDPCCNSFFQKSSWQHGRIHLIETEDLVPVNQSDAFERECPGLLDTATIASIGAVVIGATAVIVRHILAGRAEPQSEFPAEAAVEEASEGAADEDASDEGAEEPVEATPQAAPESDLDPEPES